MAGRQSGLGQNKLINTLIKQLEEADEALTKAKRAIEALKSTLEVFYDISDKFESLDVESEFPDCLTDSDSLSETD